jgi:two-component system sensor histidine kinase ChvG
MAWGTSTKTKKRGKSAPRKPAPQRRGGGLTVRILLVNIIAPFVLLLGLLYMGEYREGLIAAELETLKAQSQLFAGAIAEGAVRPVEKGKPFLFAKPEEIETLVPELSRRMVRRLGETTNNRTRLFDETGTMMGDSQELPGPGGVVQVTTLDPPASGFTFSGALAFAVSEILDLLPNRTRLPTYHAINSNDIGSYPDAAQALQGYVSATAWQDKEGRLILTAAAPVQKIKQPMGVVMLSRDGREIEYAMARVRLEVFTVFVGALSITIFVSLYLAGTIARPLRKLANAAEAIRTGKGRHVDIPDLTRRRDEVGELSAALRAMTQALMDRMDTIERFAADVAHEIKNPLTSLRSAVETAAIVKDKKDRDRLMDVIHHDVQRLDRLISDISQASRLDAELSRDEMTMVDLRGLLAQLVSTYENPLVRAGTGTSDQPTVMLVLPENGGMRIRGNEGRLAQVFQNLIGNALSFSPRGGTVAVRIQRDGDHAVVKVEDQGPGIPEGKLEAVFERFYSERPKHEAYGKHSGLGLSISKQIIDAHHGRIWAENIRGEDGATRGARFCVALPTVD